jgi:hypothetical protein
LFASSQAHESARRFAPDSSCENPGRSQDHPFFTGTQELVDTAGRVEKFRRRFDATTAAPKAKKRS